MEVELHPDAVSELRRLPAVEQTAMLNALAKLEAIGPTLGYPHTSQVQGTALRELRPRAGRSAWRAFYQRVGDVLRIGAIGPEAHANPRGFRTAVNLAIERLEDR
jgi:hypothetical protein